MPHTGPQSDFAGQGGIWIPGEFGGGEDLNNEGVNIFCSFERTEQPESLLKIIKLLDPEQILSVANGIHFYFQRNEQHFDGEMLHNKTIRNKSLIILSGAFPERSMAEQIAVILHEVSHFLLGHAPEVFEGTEPAKQQAKPEREADILMLRLLRKIKVSKKIKAKVKELKRLMRENYGYGEE